MAIAPFANHRPIPSHGRAMTKNLGLVLHVQAGNSSPHGWFSNPSREASSTWWVSKSGAIEQYIDSMVVAWAQGSGNAIYDSVETEGYPNEHLTDRQVESLAKLYSWGHDHHDWALRLIDRVGQGGFGWHGMGGSSWGGHPGCPGDSRKSQRAQVLALVDVGVARTNEPPVFGPAVTFEEDNMIRRTVHIPQLDNEGNGWIDTGIAFDRFLNCLVCGPSPDRDTYGWANIYWSANNTNGQARVEFEGGSAHQSLDVILWAAA